jgi:hypothetical protein
MSLDYLRDSIALEHVEAIAHDKRPGLNKPLAMLRLGVRLGFTAPELAAAIVRRKHDR